LHPSSSAVVRHVAPGQQTEQSSVQQLLRGSAFLLHTCPQSPAVGGLRPAVPSQVCNRSRIGGVADDVVVVRLVQPTSIAEVCTCGYNVVRRPSLIWLCRPSDDIASKLGPFIRIGPVVRLNCSHIL
jgi:hypothetical protein